MEAGDSPRGRIGVARRIHILDRYLPQEGYAWGSSLCGWAGVCEKTEERATCFSCQKLERRDPIKKVSDSSSIFRG